MKSLLLFILLMFFTAGFECEEKIANPPETKPPGYQEDIPWPSLADSPWPMYHHDPQSTGRSKYVGPSMGVIINKISAPYSFTGIILNKDSLLYYTTSYPGELKAVSYNGILKWELLISNEISNTPLLNSDSTIYIASGSLKEIIAIDLSGNIKWKFTADSEVYNTSLNIDKEGNLYFVDNNKTLYSISNQGTIIWKFNDSRFTGGVTAAPTFSPDGETIYVNGNNILVLAVETQTGTIKWTWGDGEMKTSPIVDSQGNLYLQPFTNAGNETIFYSIDSNGKLRWSYDYNSNFRVTEHIEPAIDINGNIYFGYDTLYALTYDGKLKWKYGLDKTLSEVITSPIICDVLNNIYLGVVGSGNPKIISLGQNGDKNWELSVEGERSTGGSPALSKDGFLLYPMWNSNYILVIK